MAEITEEPTEEQPKIKMSNFELSTYGEMYSQGAMVPMVVPPRRAEDGTPLDGEGEDGHNYIVALTDLDGRIRMYADAAIESSFDAIVAGAATAAEAQITDEVIRLVHVSMDEYIPGIEEAVMAQFPTKVSELENDAGYATTGVMDAALSHKQDTIQDLADIRSGAVAGAAAVQPGDLATVATSGSYNDLEDKPTIPAAQVNSDWNASSGVAEILHKPQLAAVATTGDYGDLSNTPSIPEPQVNSDWNADSGVAKILNKPELAPVATSGNYSDLAGKPSIPAKTSDLSNDSGFITAAGVPVKDVTVNGSSAVNAQGIAVITVPTATSALQNDSGFVGTQSAPSANQVLTFNGAAVVWADPQGGGGSDLPPITPSDEGKFLKVESGAAAWGEGGGGDGGTVTIDLGNYYNYVVSHEGDPVDVSGVYAQIFSAVWDGKKVLVTSLFSDVAVLSGYVDMDTDLISVLPMLKQYYTKEEALAQLITEFENEEYRELVSQLYGFHVYVEGNAAALESTVGVRFRIIPVDRYVDAVYFYADKGHKGFTALYENILTPGLCLVPWNGNTGGVTGYKWVENDPYYGTGYKETYAHMHTDIADLVNKRGKKFKFRGYAKTSKVVDGQLLHYIAEYRAYYTDISIIVNADDDLQNIILKVESPYLNQNISPNKYIEDDSDRNWESRVGDAVACTLTTTFALAAEYEGFVLDSEDVKNVGVPIPEVTPEDEGKVLMVVNGVPTWTTLN